MIVAAFKFPLTYNTPVGYCSAEDVWPRNDLFGNGMLIKNIASLSLLEYKSLPVSSFCASSKMHTFKFHPSLSERFFILFLELLTPSSALK